MATMKSLENVRAQIDRIGRIASRWSATQAVSDMERELMLDKLRELYEEVLFLDWEQPQDEKEPKTAGVQDPEPEIVPVQAAAPQGAAVPQAPEVAAEPAPAEDLLQEPLSGLASEVPAQGEPVAVVWEQQSVTTVSETTSEQKLFSDEPHVRTRVDKQVILSLYGDSSPVSSPHVGARQVAVQPQRSYEPEIGAQPDSASTAPVARDHHTAAPQNGHGPKVLGEVIGTPGESLGERLGKQNTHVDVASKLRSSTITDLQHSIGINDRFLLINELFGGNVSLYEQTLVRLNEFTGLDDAMIYIQENFDWNPDGQGTLLLVDLLERKLEN